MNNWDVIKRNQYKGLKRLQGTLNSFFDNTRWLTNESWEKIWPLSELTEDKGNYYFEVDLPGIKREEIKIEIEENILRVQGERKEKKQRESIKPLYSEIFYGSFAWEFILPTLVKKEVIKAHCENGVLFIKVPKLLSKSKAQSINIE